MHLAGPGYELGCPEAVRMTWMATMLDCYRNPLAKP